MYRICKTFTVESGHMLSKHPEKCRFPHGHSRRIEVVVAADRLDKNDMVVDFKALKLALKSFIDQFDHTMAINRADELLGAMQAAYPQGVVVFDEDPTTEVFAKKIFDFVTSVFETGFQSGSYFIFPNTVRLERVRVWETASSWAEYSLA
ncbi:MAG: 6-carboxytetrahydropterin synthase [Armatimonadetes bacterium]|nr:6-carboxytetrahydropterin synthase [Armatimonadota bacterium]